MLSTYMLHMVHLFIDYTFLNAHAGVLAMSFLAVTSAQSEFSWYSNATDQVAV